MKIKPTWFKVLSALIITLASLGVIWCHIGSAAAGASQLALSLEPTLDSNGNGNIKATTITKAELLNKFGVVIKTATISQGSAIIDVTGLGVGDYFIRVNDLGDDLIPTRIDNSSASINQLVGEQLRTSVIGSIADPTYRIKTYSKGNGEHPVVRYSSGANISDNKFAYAIMSLKTTPQSIETRLLGNGALLSSFSPSSSSPHSFQTWIFGNDNHGKEATKSNYAICVECHGNPDTHASSHKAISIDNGWCYSCHFGKGGDPNGMVSFAKPFSGKVSFPITYTLVVKDSSGKPSFTSTTENFAGTINLDSDGNSLLPDDNGSYVTVTGDNGSILRLKEIASLSAGSMFLKGNGEFSTMINGNLHTAIIFVDSKGTFTSDASGDVNSINLAGKIGGGDDLSMVLSGKFKWALSKQ